MTEGVDTERTAVRTYVPAYQRDEWDDHADQLGMSRSEFVRSMVQAGRRSVSDGEDDPAGTPDTETGPADGTETAGSGDLESRVIDALRDSEFLTWEELLGELTDDIEDRLETALAELQAEDTVRYSGRNGGYTLQHEQ